MDEITLKNFRCFHEEQIARLAPLTLLVGENSTGKTSFMAMIRALWDMAYGYRVPDFKEDPYDLGSFDELAHHRGAKGGRADIFEAGFNSADRVGRVRGRTINNEVPFYRFEMTFGKKGTAPVPAKTRLALEDVWIDICHDKDLSSPITFGTSEGVWLFKMTDAFEARLHSDAVEMTTFSPAFHIFRMAVGGLQSGSEFIPLQGSGSLTENDLEPIERLVYGFLNLEERPYASAPVRSKPRRTYDPSRPTRDPDGDYVPMYLASVYFGKEGWTELKDRIEHFGQSAGLFDEISIKSLGRRDSEPFQIQVRKFGGGLKGPRRNLIDVGYGVSQVLPVITELLRSDAPPVFLLQQPEVHLHPSAQAALGSLFCRVASQYRPKLIGETHSDHLLDRVQYRPQLIVETHSDHLLDRVRMDVRDGAGALQPDDVSILFFERGDLDVRIHSLRLDEQGNVLNAPEGYRSFFMEETTRSLGL